jgi:hypothetical protein
LANCIKKEDLTILFTRDSFYNRYKHWLRVKGWKKIYQANSHQKQARIAILVSDKVDFKLTLVKQDKEQFMLIKGAIHQKKISVIHLYAPKISAPNFIKHTLKKLKTHIDSNPVEMGDFNTPLSPIDRSSKQKINKKF